MTRLPIQMLDASGAGAFPILASMVGTTRFHQGCRRNAAHLEGTGAVVTSGLAVAFGP